MTLIEMAKEAGFEVGKMIAHDQEIDWAWPKENARKSCVSSLERFAALVAEKEREECAKEAENMSEAVLALLNATSHPKAIAAKIRVRGQK
jgi:hypothetical protein